MPTPQHGQTYSNIEELSVFVVDHFVRLVLKGLYLSVIMMCKFDGNMFSINNRDFNRL